MTLRLETSRWRVLLRRVGRKLFRYAENNDNPRLETNGELWLLRRLVAAHVERRDGRPFVALDVGANVGRYTRQLLAETRRAQCRAQLHVFEPSPACAAELQRLLDAEAGVEIIHAAVGERAGDAALFAGATGSSLASLVQRPMLENSGGASVSVPVIRLQDYAKERSLGRVNLLKLDVEGAELAALRGAGDWLTPGAVDVIQFEYGGTTLDAGVTLRDLFQLLVSRGYVVGKLLPRAIALRTYEAWMENYDYANYVALAPRWQQERTGGARRA